MIRELRRSSRSLEMSLRVDALASSYSSTDSHERGHSALADVQGMTECTCVPLQSTVGINTADFCHVSEHL